jgi:hypothetical protein
MGLREVGVERDQDGGITINRMRPSKKSRKTSWYLIAPRVLLVTFLLTLLSFAVSLLLGILGLVIAARLRGLHPNLTIAYSRIALPAAAVVATIVVICTSLMEIRHYRQAKALAEIERISR